MESSINDSGPLSQKSAHAEQYAQTKKLTLTLVLTVTDTGGAVLTFRIRIRITM